MNRFTSAILKPETHSTGFGLVYMPKLFIKSTIVKSYCSEMALQYFGTDQSWHWTFCSPQFRQVFHSHWVGFSNIISHNFWHASWILHFTLIPILSANTKNFNSSYAVSGTILCSLLSADFSLNVYFHEQQHGQFDVSVKSVKSLVTCIQIHGDYSTLCVM